MDKYVRFDEQYDSVLRIMLQNEYSKEYKKGWIITQIIPNPAQDKWIIKWEKNLFEKEDIVND